MRALTGEERKLAEELLSDINKRTNAIVESRLSAEVGSGPAAKIMRKTNEMIEKGMNEEEIAEALRSDPEIMSTVDASASLAGVGAATVIAMAAYVTSEVLSD